jgi:hypothetical protein
VLAMHVFPRGQKNLPTLQNDMRSHAGAWERE